MKELKEQLERDLSSVQTTTAYFVTLPTEDAHHGHPAGEGVAGFSQRMNEKVATKISEIVADGIIDIPQVWSLLRHYVMHDLCKDNPPNPMTFHWTMISTIIVHAPRSSCSHSHYACVSSLLSTTSLL